MLKYEDYKYICDCGWSGEKEVDNVWCDSCGSSLAACQKCGEVEECQSCIDKKSYEDEEGR